MASSRYGSATRDELRAVRGGKACEGRACEGKACEGRVREGGACAGGGAARDQGEAEGRPRATALDAPGWRLESTVVRLGSCIVRGACLLMYDRIECVGNIVSRLGGAHNRTSDPPDLRKYTKLKY